MSIFHFPVNSGRKRAESGQVLVWCVFFALQTEVKVLEPYTPTISTCNANEIIELREPTIALVVPVKGSTQYKVHFVVDRTGRGIYERVMPRKPRVEYAGAMYHVMGRGDRREDIWAGRKATWWPGARVILAN